MNIFNMEPINSYARSQCHGSHLNHTKGKLRWSAAEKPSASFPACEKDFPGEDVKVNLKRRRVEEVLNTYRELSSKLLHKYEADEQGHMANVRRKVRTEVAMYLKKQHKWVNTRKQLGPIPGIEVGDKFQCRAEQKIIGLHCQFESGIDYMKKDGVLLATSIVESKRYANVRKSSNFLTYIGQGGNPRVRSMKPTDQKLIQGNLAMMNSMEARSPVRVILKVGSRSNITFIYDGLYIVEKMTQVRGEFGKLVYSFFMTKISEQPPTSISPRKMIHKPKSCVVAQREVVCSNDISQGQEKIPIRVVTSINHDDLKPSPFDYIVNNVYPEGYVHPEAIPNGCDCIDGCMNNEKCACALKNGGRLHYDCSRKLTDHTNSLICECGPSCKCSSSCTNRVTQFGIQFQLEIFKTEMKGWGVRTRSFIPSGSFVCEFVGEICLDREANSGMDADQYSFNLGVGFIDAIKRGNVGRFINHSCSPNLCVKDVLYDHDDQRFPRKMLFALKSIPSGRELCYDNCMRGNSNANSSSKVWSNICHCGSAQCIGKI